ncbi:MAG TPA: sugar ABC transporter substrate-binding protein [Clostridiales bacterium]|nr:sugar ABC transporter substrate-binding protein [Clostridiales bacterium]
MKKTGRILSMALSLVMVMCMFTACSQKAGSTDTAGGTQENGTQGNITQSAEVTEALKDAKKVALCTMTTEGDFWNFYYENIRAKLADQGAEMDIIDADMDAVRQIEQIDNCVTQGYDLIFTIAVDPNAISDACSRAMAAGVPVFAFIKDPGEQYRTSFRGGDETKVAHTLVQITMEWIEEHFPDAAEGSINTIVIGGIGAGSETERFNATCEKLKEYPQLNIMEEVQWETSQSYAQSATENLITKYKGDINLFVVCSGEMALGVRSTVMAEGSVINDYTDFGIFTVDLNAEIAESIKNAAQGTDVIRTACVNGGNITKACEDIAKQCMDIINGNYEKFYPVNVDIATADNMADFGF